MKRIAILGGTGMAGHVSVIYLCECGYDVHYMSRSAPNTTNSKPLDATDIPAVHAWLDSINPDIILNCIGLLVADSDTRPDKAIFLNAYLPQYLAQIYKNTDVKIIHLSTDCVFSGKRGNYLESDIPDGETVYDRTKSLGEILNSKDLTLRMSIIGPDCDENGVGLFNWFMKQSGTINGFTRAMWNGVTTIELARAINEAITQDLTGLYQLTPGEVIDKFSLLLLFQNIFGKTDVIIQPCDNYAVDKTLINTRKDFNFKVRDYQEQIKNMQDWIERYSELYKHY